MSFIAAIIIGGLAGWIASQIMKTDTGLVANIGIGVLGAIVANLLFGLIGIVAVGIIGRLVFAAVGACILIFVWRRYNNA